MRVWILMGFKAPARPQNIRHWDSYRQMAMGDPDAAERGRLMAAHKIATDPEARARVEQMFGVEYCMANYPEAYRNTGRFSGVVQFLERLRKSIPW